ncbi:putative DNA-binding domain-containing protein [Shewanella sp. JM162201]|uniref:DNA-binding domain-containing protein n=1 Tax=Shewanella jiangmenensis TaxID=2837387 RepID=A0ABS5V0H5_9GAMM|nr:putative DNA-binding domain-containing protein [Shewanella jiangmenensis]MBT1443116.1 putative DNA-binding domain-containing protein [Shewanella jiangmenensis]
MSLKAIQDEFIAAIREPSRPCPDGIEARRMAVYRELFFNNVSGFVGNAFPVLKSLYSVDDWQALVREFFIHHDCQNPLFVGIAGEFLQFIGSRTSKPCDPPFMQELAHYEWLELVVAIAPDAPDRAPFSAKDIDAKRYLELPLLLASHCRIAQYHYQVEQISVDYRPAEPAVSAQYFCLFRDSADEVSFLKLNPLTAQVLALIERADGVCGPALMDELASLYPALERSAINQGVADLLHNMALKGVIVQKL